MNTESDFEHRVFSVAEAAAHLRISRSFFYALVAEKKIKLIKLGGRSLVTGKALSRFLSEAERGA